MMYRNADQASKPQPLLDMALFSHLALRRNAAGTALMKRAPSQSIKQWPERSSFFVHEHRQRLTSAWVDGRLSNFDYLLHLNTLGKYVQINEFYVRYSCFMPTEFQLLFLSITWVYLAGRTFNDLCQYPVMPWVLSNYVSQEIPDLYDKSNFRDMSKPMGALNDSRLEDFMERFETFQDPTIPPFMYGSHYSTNAGVVLHFLVRLHPYAGLHRQLQVSAIFGFDAFLLGGSIIVLFFSPNLLSIPEWPF
jgi:hypothetical protein